MRILLIDRNLEGESALEKSLEHLESWMTKLHEDKHTRRLYKKEIRSWKLKIYLALAKYNFSSLLMFFFTNQVFILFVCFLKTVCDQQAVWQRYRLLRQFYRHDQAGENETQTP